MKIAVISDVHIGPQARSEELCPQPLPEKSVGLLKEEFIGRFRAFVASKTLRADVLVVAGDITSSAAYSQFCLGADVAQRVAECLGVEDSKIYFVPGNHDVDWDVLTIQGGPSDQDFRWRNRYQPLEGSAGVFGNLLKKLPTSLTASPYCAVVADEPLVVALANSAWHDRPNSPVHYGALSKNCLSELDSMLSNFPWAFNQVRVMVVHHHPIQYQAPSFAEAIEDPDFSILQNAEALLSIARRHRIDILIHGHKHIPRFQTHLIESTYPIQVLGAGSFSVRLHSAYAGSVLNQFHIIDVVGRRASVETVYGRLHSWEYAGANHWRPSEKRSGGIASPIGFGFFSTKDELRQVVAPMLHKALARSPLVKWEDLCARVSDLEYAHPLMVEELLSELASSDDLVLHGEDPRTFLLFKELPR